MFYNLIVIISSFIIPLFLIKEPIKEVIKGKDFKSTLKKYKYEFVCYILIVIGILIRSISITSYPSGLNVDEASSGYEAFSIMNYGIDRNGHSFPVFLEAWGSGQNALYSYLMIPFIKVLGLNLLSTRLPMVIISCISLFVWYYLLSKIKDKKFALFGLLFLVICPWHIMKSRWGLESNIFPDLTLYSIYFIFKYIESKKDRYFYIGFLLLGLTSYAYGTSYFFLPLFCIPLLLFLKHKKEINLSKVFIGLGIVTLVSFPIILYVLINSFGLNEFKIGIFTIPKLLVNRYEEQTGLFSGNLLVNLFNNFYSSIKFLLIQNDGIRWNVVPPFGMIYGVTIPFVFLGVFNDFKEKCIYNNVFKIWFLSSSLLLFVLNNVNINRINIFLFPLIYYAVVGIYNFVKNSKILFKTIVIAYLIQFIVFSIMYFSREDFGYIFTKNVEEVIKYVEKLDVDEVYFDYSCKEPYIYFLYYTKYNPKEFLKTVEYFNDEKLGTFDEIKGFGKYNFYMPEEIYFNKSVAYIYKKTDGVRIDAGNNKIKEFKEYVIIYNN